jgi:hypothetical protein
VYAIDFALINIEFNHMIYPKNYGYNKIIDTVSI